uniref:Cytochrome P450 n=1 Tax=Oryza brachyantha TaxID=4533 RepID=J3MNC0_ORYBR
MTQLKVKADNSISLSKLQSINKNQKCVVVRCAPEVLLLSPPDRFPLSAQLSVKLTARNGQRVGARRRGRRVFLCWFGSTPEICVGDVGLAKRVLSDRTGLFPKNVTSPVLLKLLGNGLVLANGDEWQRHKKVVHPAFNTDKLKTMTATMAGCARSMVARWEEGGVASHGGRAVIELSGQFEEVTADVISHTAFGSSYAEGKQVFMALRELQFITFSTLLSVQIPGSRYFPTKKNLRVWMLDKKVRSTLMEIINNRLAAKEKAGGYGDDLLGLMLEASAPAPPEHGESRAPLLSMGEIIDECKTFFFAGQETTSHLLTWTMFLLSTHPEWQEKLRQEAVRECGCGGGDRLPTYDMLCKLKLMNLFLLETLRLYSPVPLIRRRTRAPVEMGGFTAPAGAILTLPIATMHRDEEVWGTDAGVFDPTRFDGAAGRRGGKKAALLSFSLGPRACIGQSFAMVETKAAVAAILRRFRLALSPEYVHAPTDVITLRPKHGLPMIVTSVHT